MGNIKNVLLKVKRLKPIGWPPSESAEIAVRMVREIVEESDFK